LFVVGLGRPNGEGTNIAVFGMLVFSHKGFKHRFFYLLNLGSSSSSSSVMSSSDSSRDSLLEGRFLNSDSSDDEEQETVDSTGLYARYARLRFIKQQQTKAVLLMKVILKDSANTRNPKWNSYRIIWEEYLLQMIR
jgi:hypothetical protein